MDKTTVESKQVPHALKMSDIRKAHKKNRPKKSHTVTVKTSEPAKTLQTHMIVEEDSIASPSPSPTKTETTSSPSPTKKNKMKLAAYNDP